MRFRKLRIAWSVAWGIVAVLLIALWVRSYWWSDSIVADFTTSLCTQVDSGYGICAFVISNHKLPGNTWVVHSDSVHNPRFPYGEYPPPHSPIWGFFSPYIRVDDGVIDASVILPTWFAITVTASFAAFPWLSFRFSLRALLIATTLVAMALGLIVWLR